MEVTEQISQQKKALQKQLLRSKRYWSLFFNQGTYWKWGLCAENKGSGGF